MINVRVYDERRSVVLRIGFGTGAGCGRSAGKSGSRSGADRKSFGVDGKQKDLASTRALRPRAHRCPISPGNLQYGIFDKLLLNSKRLTNLR